MANERGTSSRKRVAIVGSGCAGLGAAWALRDSDYDVHILEKSHRLGGHTNTQAWRKGSEETPVDTGFIVMNSFTYPNFLNFLDAVEIEPVPTEMTFGVSRDQGIFEWSGEARGIFAQKRNIFRPSHWHMIFDIIRFNQFALDLLAQEDRAKQLTNGHTYGNYNGVTTHPKAKGRQSRSGELTIGQYLKDEGYSEAFRDNYLIPMTAAVWSTSPNKASLDFPAETLVRFLWNHHLLSTVASRPTWLTIPGGSQRYIDAVVDGYPAGRLHLHTSTKVESIRRPLNKKQDPEWKVKVGWTEGTQQRSESFDHVIMACHGDEILPLLTGHGSISREEQEIFSTFETTENVTYLHSDLSLMPKRRAAWSAWNYLVSSSAVKSNPELGVSLTYWMNCLQHISEEVWGPVMVTMNPPHEPKPELTQGKYIYQHPLYNTAAVHAQKRLEEIQNIRGVSYCGAWTKYGFHEDGFSSGLRCAMEYLGAKLPFDFVDSTYRRGHKPELCWQDYLLRILISIILVAIRIIEAACRLPVLSFFGSLVVYIASTAFSTIESLLDGPARGEDTARVKLA